jgi:hypothetical protein
VALANALGVRIVVEEAVQVERWKPAYPFFLAIAV